MQATFRSLTAGLIAAGGAGWFGWSADAARAQSSCVEQCPVPVPVPMVVPVPVYVVYSSCGQFHYRREGVCVDARIEPPRLD